MAGLPPGAAPGPLGGTPPGIAPPGPQAPPPPGLPPGMMPGMSAPQAAPASPFTDLVDKLPSHYQLLDVAASQIDQAINTGGFYREPKVLAGVREIHAQLSALIANRAREGRFGTPEASPARAMQDLSGSEESGGASEGDDSGFEEGADTEP